jgi:CMP-N,N'-diacetyllegionaminic acid synthase
MDFPVAKRFTEEGKKKTAWVDIDETICYYEGERKYNLAIPIAENIAKINKLYDSGEWIVIYWTARGSTSGIDYTEFTAKQLTSWGCRFHDLKCGPVKGHFDMIIDDKAKRIEEL